MPNRPMERFLTRRSISLLTGSLAFIVMYWYIRRQRRLKWFASENKNRKVNAKSCSQKNFDDLKESKSNSKENVALAVKLNDDTMSGDSAGDAVMNDNQFERRLSDDLLIAELDNDVIHANDIPVLEISTNSLSELEKTPVDSLPCLNKVSVASEEGTVEYSSVWMESKAKVGNICITRNATDRQSADPNIIEYRPLNTPSSEVQFFN
ncbi:hypothetical protein WUBG_04706 [Wuchereria bancrofti]|uniref:Uncharacterized protein n=1 Tax=Wuchereria bancrofti TaxID=6293 RepID=J9FAJ5_WUCBA|nr:hypothetical protein WUBG_04706 [Wuchereria bancrofti]VDM09142.1 unnamed protein product [Wuchereria bancrofti]